jgi:hypothetical protein
MAEIEARSERPSLPNLMPSGLAAMGKKNMEEFAKAQAELLRTLQETHHRWLDRIQFETKFASEFAHKVADARCIPDAVAACQEWTSRRFELMANDSNRILADSRKVMETGTRFLSNGLFVSEQGGASAEAPRFRGGAGGDGEPISRHGRGALRETGGGEGE